MTKRAGRRKHRMGKGPLKPPASASPPSRDPAASVTLPDNLPPSTSLAIELAAIREGWILPGATGNKIRQALLNKMTSIALKSPDDRTAIRAIQVLVMAEQRELMLAKQVKGRTTDDLPDQVPVAEPAAARLEGQEPWRVIQDLLGNQNVIDAIVTKSAPG